MVCGQNEYNGKHKPTNLVDQLASFLTETLMCEITQKNHAQTDHAYKIKGGDKSDKNTRFHILPGSTLIIGGTKRQTEGLPS